jgi:hypothetical protein
LKIRRGGCIAWARYQKLDGLDQKCEGRIMTMETQRKILKLVGIWGILVVNGCGIPWGTRAMVVPKVLKES